MKKTYKVSFISYVITLIILVVDVKTNSWGFLSTFLLLILLYETYQICSNFVNNRSTVRINSDKPTLKEYINYIINLFFREQVKD